MKKTILIVLLAILLAIIAILIVNLHTASLSHVPPSNKLPTTSQEPDSTAECNNGKYSSSTSNSGTCSSNGGVKVWIVEPEPKNTNVYQTAPTSSPEASQAPSTTIVNQAPAPAKEDEVTTQTCALDIKLVKLGCKE